MPVLNPLLILLLSEKRGKDLKFNERIHMLDVCFSVPVKIQTHVVAFPDEPSKIKEFGV